MKVIVNEDNANDTAEFISKRLSAIKNQRTSGELEDLALIIGSFIYDAQLFIALHDLQMARVSGLHLRKNYQNPSLN